MIDINKKYRTKSGLKVRILATDLKDDFPVVTAHIDSKGSEFIRRYNKNGKYYDDNIDHQLDLVEYNPAEDLNVDDRILVKAHGSPTWLRRHFSHLGKHGKVYAFIDGCTSFTCEHTTDWDEWKLPE